MAVAAALRLAPRLCPCPRPPHRLTAPLVLMLGYLFLSLWCSKQTGGCNGAGRANTILLTSQPPPPPPNPPLSADVNVVKCCQNRGTRSIFGTWSSSGFVKQSEGRRIADRQNDEARVVNRRQCGMQGLNTAKIEPHHASSQQLTSIPEQLDK